MDDRTYQYEGANSQVTRISPASATVVLQCGMHGIPRAVAHPGRVALQSSSWCLRTLCPRAS